MTIAPYRQLVSSYGARQIPYGHFKLNRHLYQADHLEFWLPPLGSRGGDKLIDFAGKNDGIFSGSPTWDDDPKIGPGLSFDGTNDHIDLVATGVSGAQPRTFACWIKSTNVTSTRLIFKYGAEVSHQLFGLAIVSPGKLYFECNTGDKSSNSDIISTNVLYHIALVYRGGDIGTLGNLEIFLDGKSITLTAGLGGTLNTLDSAPDIGNDPNTAGRKFPGFIGPCDFYSRDLSPEDVLQEYLNPWYLYQPTSPPQFWVGRSVEAGISISLDTALLTANGQALALAPGEATTSLDTADLTAGGQTLSLLMGSVSTLLDTALLNTNGQALSFLMGAVSALLDTAGLTASGQVISLVVGEISIGLGTALVTADGQVINVVLGSGPQTIFLETANLDALGQALDVSPGAVTITLLTAALQSQGQQVVLSPGAVSVLLDTPNLVADGQQLALLPGEVITLLETATLLAEGQNIDIPTAVEAIVRIWTLLGRSVDWDLDDRDSGWTVEER